jgi:hypothetical protein
MTTDTTKPWGELNPIRSTAPREPQTLYRGKKPLMLGINRRKRNAREADRKDRVTVLRTLGAGFPKNSTFHSELVKQRHSAYRPEMQS